MKGDALKLFVLRILKIDKCRKMPGYVKLKGCDQIPYRHDSDDLERIASRVADTYDIKIIADIILMKRKRSMSVFRCPFLEGQRPTKPSCAHQMFPDMMLSSRHC